MVRDFRTAAYAQDKPLVERIDAEIKRALAEPKPKRAARPPVSEAGFARAASGDRIREESIALRRGRPVLGVTNGAAVLKVKDPESRVWIDRIGAAATALRNVIPSIGRIELDNYLAMPVLATGWMVQPGIVVTNRHVAQFFAERGAGGFRFMMGDDPRRPIGVSIDFLEEVDSAAEAEFTIDQILHVGGPREADVALLRVAPVTGTALPPALDIDVADPVGKTVAVIGYPQADSRIPDQALMFSIFGEVFDRKRLAPGFVKSVIGAELSHDCTTLGGNSGSPVVELEHGKVVGLHKSGVFLDSNGAVAAGALRDIVDTARRGPMVGVRVPDAKPPASGELKVAANEVSVTVPVTITVRIGETTVARVDTGAFVPPPAGSVTMADVEAAVPAAQQLLAARPDVVAVYAGLRVTGGKVTDEPVLVVAVTERLTPEVLALKGMIPIPNSIAGVPTDVTFASIADQLGLVEDWSDVEAAWVSRYVERPALKLEAATADAVTLSVSPDCGWPVLKTFLSGVRKSLTVGMYDFTAPHILKAVVDATKPGQRRLKLVLQAGEDIGGVGAKKDDVSDIAARDQLASALKQRFQFSWASVAKPFGRIGNPEGIFDSAYHIKVAVKDHASFWLSSGNWQSSNQPPLGEPSTDLGTPNKLLSGYNREWHAVVEGPKLAQLYEDHLLLDLKEAKKTQNVEAAQGDEPYVWVPVEYFVDPDDTVEAPYVLRKPMTIDGPVQIHPLLTPDNYAKVVAGLIEGAEHRVLFQNQSLKLAANDGDAPHFKQLVDALLHKQQAPGVDVRIIFRRIGDDLRKTLTRLKLKGFDFDKLRLNGRCHTKGLIIDNKVVVLGSHNWTNSGTKFNRDASLAIYHSQAVAYFTDLFEEDWRRAREPSVDENLPSPRMVNPLDSEAPPRMVRVPLRDWVAL